ncbi:SEC7 domain-containing protein [Caenorhabditis elegans]|uniref:SEC7 domain-containing protein n=1 Tax=Caenorhabditis elegans TaxID=6239 RepID=G5EFH7_CAEEL|nr:SEC7 domain-containing protein [Caenorhabditis elegans]CAA21704.3 SEC7 domain-containing protein [Caenorhabditis elegans]|eukprot:NP_001021798.2 Arf-1 Guanine nucleotide Exchange Factor homolog [Caenorhabditis elegans]
MSELSNGPKKSIGNMFLRSGIEKILADRDIKRKENLQLKKACESALEELKAAEEQDASPSSNGEHLPDAGGTAVEADRYFLPFELACNSKSPKIVITALDCLQKLIAYGHLTGRGADISNPERKLIDRIVEAICAPFLGQGTDETVLLQLIKAVLAVVLSTHCEVHGASLILAVRTCFNIYLTSKSPINQATAKGTLTQVINTVFGNMEKFGNIKDDETIVREVVEVLVSNTISNEVSDETSEAGGTHRQNGSTMGESEAPLDDQFTFMNAYQKDAFLVFRALCILAQKEEGGASNEMSLRSKLLALEMLLLVLQNSSSILQSSQPCIIVIKRTLCMALTRNAVSNNIQVFEKSLAIFVELLDKFKTHLKASIEVFFNSVILPMLDSNTCAFEQKWIVLNTIGKILANPQSVVDMFVNYDCDMTSPNLFKSIVEVVSKTTRTTINENAPPAQKEKERAMRLLGLSCLTDLLQCLVDWWQVCEVQKITSDIDDAEPSEQQHGETFEAFETLKQQKNLMEQGIQIFSEKPKKGLKFLQEHGFVGTDAVEVAEFMMKEERLNKTQVGDFLGDSDEFNNSVMHAYIDFLDFSSIDILAALRMFLEKFRLPGEAQKIDRLMLKFASRYLDCNPRQGIFASADAAYVLAFSIIMLTTDLHNKTVKNKMTKQGYINMNRGINEGGNIPVELLEAIFEDISKNEIKMRAGATALLRSRVTPGQGALATDKERRAMAALEMEALSETARALMESASDADAYFTPAQHQHHVKPMFKICWTPCLAAFSVGVQMSDDEEEWSLCLRGFRLGVRAACVLQATLERNAFIQALARFTLLTAKNSLGEMRVKNIEAIKLLLLIGDEDGEYLEENWVDVMKCMSSLELVQLIGTGLNSAMSHDTDSSRQYVMKATGGIDEKTLHSLQDALGETSSQSVVVAIDRIFNGSARLSAEAIVYFVRALCAVSREELSHPAAPRMFLLGKVVEVAFYNMNRIRLEWSRIWNVIGEHFNAAGCNSNEAVAYFSVDALRQLSIKFLEKGELPNFRFQKDFLRPFEVIMVRNGSAQTRDLVVRCCAHLVEAHSSRLKSGWQNLFSVWTIAAGDPSTEIGEASFLTAQKVIEKRFKEDFPAFLDSFQEALKCLQEFACNQNQPDMNMEAIRLIRLCADYVSENSDKIDEAARRDDHLHKGLTADQHVWLRGWFPIFFELSCIINRCKLDVRTRSLTVMFEIMKHHGSDFRPEWWKDLLEIVFRIFDPSKMDDHRSDKREWMSTTCNHAMLSVVEVFTQFYTQLSVYALPMIYRQFGIFIRQQNEQLARCTISCLESLISQNGERFTEPMWEQTIELIRELFETTLPKSLLTWEPPNSNGIGSEDRTNGSDTLSSEQIVFCVVQNELVEAVSRIVLGDHRESKRDLQIDGLFTQMSPQLLLSICDALAESHTLAKQFNNNNGQRVLIWKARLLGSTKPNLINQETRSLSAMLAILFRLLYDLRAQSISDKIAIRVLEVVSLALSGYGEAESDTRRTAYGPVICELLRECIALPTNLIPVLGPEFPLKLCDLVETAEDQTMRKLLAELFRRIINFQTKSPTTVQEALEESQKSHISENFT